MQPLAIADLERSGIAPADAETCQLWDVPNAATIYPDFRAEPAVVIPYFNPDGSLMTFERDGTELPFCRVRYLDPPKARSFGGSTTAPKYGQPGKSGTRAYFPPNTQTPWTRIMRDPEEACILVEGEKKAIAGAANGFPVIALGGVWNFALGNGDGLMPELEAANHRGKHWYICFDSDRALNANIRAAEARLVDELHKRGATCHLVELPQDGEKKVGLDDFLVSHGPAALRGLLENAPSLGALDAKVVSLNRRIAWIDREGCAFDLKARQFIQKDNLVSGHELSSLKYITVGGRQRTAPKEISVAQKWLTHPHATRYPEILFRPGQGQIVTSEQGQPALNMWNGWTAEHDVKPTDPRVTAFLALTKFLFQNMEKADRDLPLKLLAYKAQHPMRKIGLCPVLIGEQGCGKSLWSECVSAAFAPYSENLNSAVFGSDFNGWVERAIIAVVNEVSAQHVRQHGEKIKSLITDLRQPMRELYRPMRQVESHTFYIMTANDRAVGSFEADDRRMIVVDCPSKMTHPEGVALYTYLGIQHGRWHKENGPAALMGYLLELDLGDWTPPLSAPMTAEKMSAYREGLSVIQELAAQMKSATGNTVTQWIEAALATAREGETSNVPGVASVSRATLDSMKHWPVRPFYEPSELALLFPNLAATILGGKYEKATTPGKISRDLRNAGIKYLRNRDNPAGFKWRGQARQYLIVCDQEDWAAGLTQAEFERAMNSFPIYGRGVRK